jgi:hypothetical protein
MSSKSPVRSCEDVDETALSYAEIKALCAGNPLIAEKMTLDNEVAKLRMLRSEHNSQHYRLEDSLLKTYPKQIAATAERIDCIAKDIADYAAIKEKCVEVVSADGAASVSAKFPGMTVNGVDYTEKEPAAKALLEACKGVGDKTDKPVGEYMGFKLSIRFDSFTKQISLLMRGHMTYSVELGTDAFGNITRINNALDGLDKRLEGQKSSLENLQKQEAAAREELGKPFPQEAELAEKEARLALLNADLNIDGDGGFDVENDTDDRDEAGQEQGDGNGRDYIDDRSARQATGGIREYAQETELRTGTYGKSKPSLLDDLRSYSANKQNSEPGGTKQPGREI